MSPPLSPFRLAQGALTVTAAVAVVATSAWLALRPAAVRHPATAVRHPATAVRHPARAAPPLLVAHARVAQPHLLAVPGGFIGWWLEGAGSGRALVVAQLSTTRGLIVSRTLPLRELAPGQTVSDAPLFAVGPADRLVFTYRALDGTRDAALYLGSWNTSLRGSPQLERIRDDALVRNQLVVDHGPQGQYLSYEPQARSYLLVEERLRPWFSQDTRLPNRPQLLATLISIDGSGPLTRAFGLPPAESFIDPQVRASPSPAGFDLFVVRPGDSTPSGAQPDRLMVYRLDNRLRELEAARPLAASSPTGAILDEAVSPLPSGAELLAWEEAGPETQFGQAKQIMGTVVRDGRFTRPPVVLSAAISPQTTWPAQLMLSPQPGGALLAFDTGPAAVFETVRADTTTTRVGTLFQVRHRLSLQPQTALAYNLRARVLAGLWQDPGQALSPYAVAATAPLYLSGQAAP
jgi:hypothetical protein